LAISGPIAGYEALVAAGQITSDPVQERAAARLESLDEQLRDYRPARGSGLFGRIGKSEPLTGIYICGDVGRGKSMLMDLFFETAPISQKRRVHFHAFMQEVHGAIKAWRDTSDTDRRGQLRKLGLQGIGGDPIPPVAKQIASTAYLLCFDEFQVNDVADAMILGRLFDALFSFGVVVVATSNRPPADLYAGGINRQLFLPFISMLQQKMDILHLDAATDYRLDRVKGMKVYFTPNSETNDQHLSEAWATITESIEPDDCEIMVQGRRLQFAACAAGAMRESFDNLCGQALGAADYLAIAEKFHTVFVERIPKMTKANRNEAKRFVTFIDALYEHHVRLIASADGAPEELYPDGDGAFEFHRTASRLMEMQAEDYLSQPHRI